MSMTVDPISSILLHQLHSFWPEVNEAFIYEAVPCAMKDIDNCFFNLPNKRYYNDGNVVFSPYFSTHWMLFLYRVSRTIYLNHGYCDTADQVYYLNKIMNSVDWFYAIDLPIRFLCEHPVGTVLGRADYGDYLFVYQGVTVGGNRKNGQLHYPVIGNNVILYANATVLGDCHLGNNVIVSANTYLINEVIPDNTIVFGHSPNITVVQKSELEIKKYTNYIWGWEL